MSISPYSLVGSVFRLKLGYTYYKILKFEHNKYYCIVLAGAPVTYKTLDRETIISWLKLRIITIKTDATQKIKDLI